jgi:high-affinity nickel-transport protein
VAVGLFFSLGHSTIVILLSVLLAASASFVATNLPAFQAIGSKIGIAVSSLFLLMIGVINLMALLDIVHVWRHVMRGEVHDEKEIHHHLATSGVLARIFAPFLKAVSQSYHMYFVGFLFGLGFDTASEVGLLSISATTGATGVPIWETLLLPLAFTAGMAAIDTLDGVLMLGAYGWAYLKPVRKLYYNMIITLMSVIIALVIGGIEALQIMIEEFGWHGGIVDGIRNIDFGSFGYIIILAFVISWLFSAIVYRWKGYDNIRIGK